jgi:hypothetical protein
MLENIFFALTLMLASPRAPGVEISFTDGASHTTKYRLPLPLDNQSTRLHFIETNQEINLRALLVKDKSGSSWLDYDIVRKDTSTGNVDVAGAVSIPTSGPVVVGEFAGAHGPVSVRVEIVQP